MILTERFKHYLGPTPSVEFRVRRTKHVSYKCWVSTGILMIVLTGN